MNKSKALIVLSIVVVATLISGFLISRLRFDYDFEAFFPHEDPETEFYLEFRKNFEKYEAGVNDEIKAAAPLV